jgi:glycosyltransferase involved in cell wall biosynthesis
MGIELSISVIIPNFNGYKLLRNNLPDLIQALDNFPESEIIIVDDASSQ